LWSRSEQKNAEICPPLSITTKSDFVFTRPETAAEKYMAQVQHNMWGHPSTVGGASIITGGGKWVEITIPTDPLYLSVLVSAEKKFWRCVQSGEPPHLINAEPPRPRMEVIRIVDMSSSNSWKEFAVLFRNTRAAFIDQERAQELDARRCKGSHRPWLRAKRSKSGAVSFDLLETEAARRHQVGGIAPRQRQDGLVPARAGRPSRAGEPLSAEDRV
jgi:hypothetical protein